MKLCHSEEHSYCSQYNKKERKIEIVEIAKGDAHQVFSEQNQMVFIIQGSLNLHSKRIYDKNIKAGELILIPLHRTCVMTALKDTSVMIMKLDFNIAFCEHLPLDLVLEKYIKDDDDDAAVGFLKPNQRIADYISTIISYVADDNLICSYYHDLKVREVLFLVRAYHDKKQLVNFFKPIYNADSSFLSDIYKQLETARTVKQLANGLNYSLSGFEKKFKRVFDTSPYQWMQEQRARKIYKEVTCTKKTFTEIAFEYDFSSPAHFNDFCKQYFQYTPGGLRKENEKRLAN